LYRGYHSKLTICAVALLVTGGLTACERAGASPDGRQSDPAAQQTAQSAPAPTEGAMSEGEAKSTEKSSPEEQPPREGIAGEPGDSKDAESSKGSVAARVTMTTKLDFTPKRVELEKGQTVRWKNTTLLIHTVTADPDKATREGSTKLPEGAETFDSGNLKPKATFEHTFEVEGTYKYFCKPHEGAEMFGYVVVE
jgi:plastocyanin